MAHDRIDENSGADVMRALVVEDEILVALHLQRQLEQLGMKSIGIAADRVQAARLAEAEPQVAFVDMNLRDGPTGAEIAAFLHELGVKVFFMTANPAQIGDGRKYALGVIGKPWSEEDIQQALANLG